jgi:hypothetical protein
MVVKEVAHQSPKAGARPPTKWENPPQSKGIVKVIFEGLAGVWRLDYRSSVACTAISAADAVLVMAGLWITL